MSKKLIFLVSVVLFLVSVSNAADIQWTDLGPDHLWSTPENWDQGRVPTIADEVLIDVPAAAAPNGPVIQDGIDAKAKGIFTEAAGEPTLTMTGGTLEVAEWIWWGDGADSLAVWDMSGGTVTTGSEFELGWGGGAGTLTMTGGTISAAEAVIPTGTGAFGELFLYGGTYSVTNAGGLSVKENGKIDITEGTLVLEGDDTAKVNDLIAAGQITAYGGSGKFDLDFDGRNPGKTTLTAIAPPDPVDPGTDGLVAFYAMDGDTNDSSGNGLDGTIVGDPTFVEGKVGMALDLDGTDDLVELGKFDVVGQITLAAWIKPDDFEINDARIITKAKEWGQDDHWWMLSTISETSLRFRLKTDEGASTAQLISDPVLEAGVWTHVVTSWDGSMMRIYKDGAEVASTEKGGTAVAVDPDVSAAIGSQPSDAFASDPSHVVKFFDGLIDEVQIYSRALSEGEIRYLAGFRRTKPENLALNPSFEEDDVVLDDPDWYQWCTWNDAAGAGSNATIVDTDAVDGAKSLKVEPIGVENWHFIVANISFPLSSGTDFTVTFWAKAEADRPLGAQMKAADNSVSWGYTDFQLTTEWAQYTMTSTAESDEGKLEFFCAGSEVPFLLDLVSVFEADTLSGLADVTAVDGVVVSIRHEGTEYVVADGDLMLGTTTRWYVLEGVETLWAEGDPTAPQTVSGSSNPKDGDVGSKADNFNFTLDGSTNISSIDGIDFQETIFPSLTDTIIVFERNGNDVGTFQAIYADGSLGEPVAFVKASDGGPYADTGIDVNGQNAYGVVFKTSVPVQGVRITASGHDTLSISAPAP
jgi:hypothetical protein